MKSKIYFGIVIFFILLFFIFNNFNNNMIQKNPENNSIITERQPVFKWIGKANKLFIDDNDEFTTPIIENIENSPYKLKAKLNFKTYYWKLGNKDSSVFQFTVQSLVALTLKNQSDLYNITNVGNTDLEIEIHQKNKELWKITGNIVLRENETKQLKANSTLLVAKEK